MKALIWLVIALGVANLSVSLYGIKERQTKDKEIVQVHKEAPVTAIPHCDDSNCSIDCCK
jgi:hypothetical protein